MANQSGKMKIWKFDCGWALDDILVCSVLVFDKFDVFGWFMRYQNEQKMV